MLRVARPTNDLALVVAFWRDAVGLHELGGFVDHAGFDGAMLGMPGASWHLEFTHAHGEVVARAPTREHLLVLYFDDDDQFATAVARMESQGHRAVPSENPYWDRAGRTYEDPEGYRVVLQRGSWPPPR